MAESESHAKRWYLVQTKVRQEQVAVDNLEYQGYEVYLPMLEVRRRRRLKMTCVVEPMFPRYLFIHLDTSADNWSPIRSTRGVSHIIRFGQQPAFIADELIELLHLREQGKDTKKESASTFEKGEKVQIIAGAFAGHEAIFNAESSDERVCLLLDIAGRHTQIKIHQDQVDSAQ